MKTFIAGGDDDVIQHYIFKIAAAVHLLGGSVKHSLGFQLE